MTDLELIFTMLGENSTRSETDKQILLVFMKIEKLYKRRFSSRLCFKSL